MNQIKERALNAMIGLAVGDAMSWTTMYHRSYLLPLWTRRIRREMDTAAEVEKLILQPMPFSLNQPPEYFNLGPGSVTEWAAFSALIIADEKFVNYENRLNKKWISLANQNPPVRAAVSTRAAIENILNGLKPPQTGRENPHYFDDYAMPRALPIGIFCAGNPEKAAHYTFMDAGVTNSEDGIWAAQFISAAISCICAGMNLEESIGNALKYLPDNSWIKRMTDEAIDFINTGGTIFKLLPKLSEKIVNREYSYGNVAPETLALTLAVCSLHGDNFEEAVTSSICFPKSAETLPALVGAISGALNPNYEFSDYWLNSIHELKGISIPSLAGINYLSVVEQLAKSAGEIL